MDCVHCDDAGISRRLQHTHLGSDDSNTRTSVSLRLDWQFIRDTPASRMKQKDFDNRACPFTMPLTNSSHSALWLWLCYLSGYIYYNKTLPCLPLHRRFLVTRKSVGTDSPTKRLQHQVHRLCRRHWETTCRSRLFRSSQDLPSYIMTLVPGRLGPPGPAAEVLANIAHAWQHRESTVSSATPRFLLQGRLTLWMRACRRSNTVNVRQIRYR
jgi:hypothetical protein